MARRTASCFLGCWLAFGFIAPTSAASSETKPLEYCLKAATNDLTVLNPTSEGAIKLLSPSKGMSLSPGGQGIAITGPGKGQTAVLGVGTGAEPRNLSDFLYLVTDIRNLGSDLVTVICRAEDPDYAGWHHYSEAVARLAPGQTTSVLVFLKRKNAPEGSLKELFPGMHALPSGYMPIWSGLDPARITRIVLAFETSASSLHLELLGIRATGLINQQTLTRPGFFPFIDAYGQFRHADWPTKIHSDQDFIAQRQAEAAALTREPRAAAWNQYGGYRSGPRFKATGHFRVEKHEGKWWLVDPEGCLFWSHGVTGVGFSAATPVAGRRQFFTELPPAETANPPTANFYRANLSLKYGGEPEPIVAALAHDRLANWGLNTMASWSEDSVTQLGKTPYTRTLNLTAAKLAPGLKLPDPYSPAFVPHVRKALAAERELTGSDPFCIGYFIANELEWRNGPEIVNEVLTATPDSPGKRALLQLLKQRHPSVNALNAVWRTAYASWDDWLQSTNKVDAALANSDFAAFNEELAQRYYQTCQTELKNAMPQKLNLGTRFHTVNLSAVRAAARYCDVVSFNKYATSIRALSLPDGLDRPIIIGEFHFPAWDRSFTAHPERSRISQVQRADAYWYYVTGALENPWVVGVHWFQYLDQPITGRADGENWAIGFVDVTDAPYEELTKVSRELGQNMYQRRLGSRAGDSKPALTTAAQKVP